MILYLLNLGDLVSTLIALSHGICEANPVMRFLLDIHPVLFVAVKTIPAYYLCMYLATKSRKWVYWSIAGIYAVTVAWNVFNIMIV